MCGIFGFYLKNSDEHRSQEYINRFKLDLFNRGPDSFNYNSRKNCVIGISRLSIVDIHNETQPFSIKEINITVVFNGEIYNYKNLRKLLLSKGIKLKGNSEIEVIANLYKLYSIIHFHKYIVVNILSDVYSKMPWYKPGVAPAAN